MPVNRLFGGSMDVAAKALDIRSARQVLIQANIANMETPGYKVKDIPFAKVLASAVTGNGQLARTDEKHIAINALDQGKKMEFRQENRPVDLDEEMLKLSENQLMYDVAARIMTKKFEGLKYAIDEGGK